MVLITCILFAAFSMNAAAAKTREWLNVAWINRRLWRFLKTEIHEFQSTWIANGYISNMEFADTHKNDKIIIGFD